MSAARSSVMRVFAIPLLLGLATAVGLLAALLLEPFGRFVGWITLSLPIAAVLWAAARKRAVSRPTRAD